MRINPKINKAHLFGTAIFMQSVFLIKIFGANLGAIQNTIQKMLQTRT